MLETSTKLSSILSSYSAKRYSYSRFEYEKRERLLGRQSGVRRRQAPVGQETPNSLKEKSMIAEELAPFRYYAPLLAQ